MHNMGAYEELAAHRAIHTGDAGAVRWYLESGKMDPNAPLILSNANYPLDTAVFYGRYEIAEMLLQRGADPNKIGEDWGPMHIAAAHNDTAMLSLLVSYGGDAGIAGGRTGRNPLHWLADIAEEIRPETLEFLISKGIDINASDSSGMTAAHILASKRWDAEANPAASMKLLIQHDADLSKTDREGNTPLHMAIASMASIAVVLQLFSAYPDAMHTKNSAGESPLAIAMKTRSRDANYASALIADLILCRKQIRQHPLAQAKRDADAGASKLRAV